MALDLDKIRQKVDKMLDEMTKEDFEKWLKKQRGFCNNCNKYYKYDCILEHNVCPKCRNDKRLE